MPAISVLPGDYLPGMVTRSGGYRSISALYSKGGSTKGTSVVTFTGTPTYGSIIQYTVELTNALNGQISTSQGLFSYDRSSTVASLADMLGKFASHLQLYHDLEVFAVTATTLSIRSAFWGFTPLLSIQTPGYTSVNVPTSATAPSLLHPGDLAILVPSATGFSALPFRTANITDNSFYGVTLNQMGTRRNDGRDQVYDILVEGYVSCQCGGTVAKNAGNSTINIFTNGNRPGMLSFGGLSNGATASVSAAAVNTSGTPLAPVNISRQLRAITPVVVPGATFELQIMGI